MLVLARQLNERIIMPAVGATIEVVSIKPHSVRLGIDAPPQITILREEVMRRGGATPQGRLPSVEMEDGIRLTQVKQILRNRLGNVALGLEVLRQEVDNHDEADLEKMVKRLRSEIVELDIQLRSVLLDESVSPCTLVEAEGGLTI
jgi:carbon storage regulator CsrA